MTDTIQTYKRLTRVLTGTRKTLAEACKDLEISIDIIEDDVLEHHCQECSHCGIWGTAHRVDEDEFPVCGLCFRLVVR